MREKALASMKLFREGPLNAYVSACYQLPTRLSAKKGLLIRWYSLGKDVSACYRAQLNKINFMHFCDGVDDI